MTYCTCPGCEGKLTRIGCVSIARSEERPTYSTAAETIAAAEREADDECIRMAKAILAARLSVGSVMASPQNVKDYLQLRLSPLEHESFAVMFLDAQHRMMDCEEMFRGTLSQTSVYPREIVKAALRHNAAAVILSHNHPSGVAEPSRADEHITKLVKDACALVDVRVLDHFVVAKASVVSFAERGLL